MSRVLVLLAAVCFGTTGTAQALGPDGLAPAGVGAARILVGGSLLLLVALVRPGAGPLTRVPRGPALTAAAAVAVYQLAFFAAVDDTGVAVGTIVALGSAPTLTGLLEWLADPPPRPHPHRVVRVAPRPPPALRPLGCRDRARRRGCRAARARRRRRRRLRPRR